MDIYEYCAKCKNEYKSDSFCFSCLRIALQGQGKNCIKPFHFKDE